MPQYVLAHLATPPSFNRVGHSGSRWAWTRAKKEWQEIFEVLLMAQRIPRLSKVTVRAELFFPTRRRRDEGNYRTLLEKCIGDALVGDRRAWPEGRWLPDDTPEFFSFGRVEFKVGPSRTRLLIDAELSS